MLTLPLSPQHEKAKRGWKKRHALERERERDMQINQETGNQIFVSKKKTEEERSRSSVLIVNSEKLKLLCMFLLMYNQCLFYHVCVHHFLTKCKGRLPLSCLY